MLDWKTVAYCEKNVPQHIPLGERVLDIMSCNGVSFLKTNKDIYVLSAYGAIPFRQYRVPLATEGGTPATVGTAEA
jgi:hypothetical protein